MKRFFSGSPPGGSQPGFGPMVELTAHVALLPLVRVGAYVEADLSPVDGASSRRFLGLGARAKILSPWPRSPVRTWLFVGAGYVGVYSPSFERTLLVRPNSELPPASTTAAIDGAGGGFVEIPVGIGASYKLRKPWELTAEVGARFGFGFGGSNYKGRAASTPSGLEMVLVPAGKDAISIGVAVGIAFDM